MAALLAAGIAAGDHWNSHGTSAPPRAASTVDSIVVDTTHVSRVLPRGFFGINYSAFWDPIQGSAASARALTQTPIKTVRFPGGDPGDWYDWQDPYYKSWSSTSPLDLWRYTQKLGAQPLFQTNYQGNLADPPGQSYAVNSPQNAAAWVSYNHAHGIPAVMEVGNEEDIHMQQVDDANFQPYVDAFNAQARAMHAADPAVTVLGPAGTNEYYWWNRDSLGEFLKGAGNRTGSGQVDGVSLHFYAGTLWYDAKSQAQRWLAPDGPWHAIQQAIAANDTRRLPVYITEWNLGASNNNNAFTPTLGHALAVADMIGAFAQSGVAGEDYFQTHGVNGWGLLYGNGESRAADSPSPTYYAMALWGTMGDHVLPLQQSDDPASEVSAYAASRGDGSVQVLAINKQSVPRTIRIELNGASAAGHRLRITSLAPVSGGVFDLDALYNGVRTPSPQAPLPGPIDGGLVSGSAITYRVPAYTAVVLDLEGTSPAPRLTPTPVGYQAALAATPTPEPSLAITVSGAVSAGSGMSRVLTATAKSNEDVGPIMLDLEVLDSAGIKTLQQTEPITLQAGVPLTMIRTYTPAPSAYGGIYKVRVGVFGLNWSPTYSWNGAAASFTVAGGPPPTISTSGAVSPAQVTAGRAMTLLATVSAAHNSLGNALVDIEVYNASGARVCQQYQENISVPQDGSTVVSATCPGMPGGDYEMKIGVYGAGWSPRFTWNDGAASFAIK